MAANVRHMTPAELAERVGLKTSTLADWRVAGTGPRFIKFGTRKQSRVVYPVAEVEAWEQGHLQSNTAASV